MKLKNFYKTYFKKFFENIFSIKSTKYFALKTKQITLLGHKYIVKPKIKVPKPNFPPDCVDITRVNSDFNKLEKPKSVAVFASFNTNGVIKDYVIYYLKELRKYVDCIIFVTDNPILEAELDKINDLVSIAKCSRHSGYDFMSYKIGIQLAKEYKLLENAEFLILCNDSCYGPLESFAEIFEKGYNQKSDFFGLSSDTAEQEHIQSFFYIFKRNVFTSRYFINFMNKIKKLNSYIDIVTKYEFKLTKYLEKYNFKHTTFVPLEIENIKTYENKTCYPLTLLRDYKFQLVKIKVFTGGLDLQEDPKEVLSFIKGKNPKLYEIINNDLKSQNKNGQTNALPKN